MDHVARFETPTDGNSRLGQSSYSQGKTRVDPDSECRIGKHTEILVAVSRGPGSVPLSVSLKLPRPNRGIAQGALLGPGSPCITIILRHLLSRTNADSHPCYQVLSYGVPRVFSPFQRSFSVQRAVNRAKSRCCK